MRDAALPGAPQPFADDAAGAGYFSSDHHRRYLADALVRQLAKGCNVVLVSGTPSADGELLARFLDEAGAKYRASVVACRAGMNFNDLMLAYSRQLGIGVNRDKGRLWALLSHLMLETRRGVTRVLALDHAEVLDALCFDELLRFSQLDAPRPVPIVLLASPAFTELLKSPGLDFVNAAITGRLAVDRLAPEEVGAFIQYQLNGISEGGATPFSTELIALIATAADGNPAVINALAREIVLSTKPRRLTAEEMSEPEVEAAPSPVEDAEAPSASVETMAADSFPPSQAASAAPRRRRARRQGMDLQFVGYLGISVVIGAALLYALLPGRSPPPSVGVIEPAAETGVVAAVPRATPQTTPATAADTAPAEPAPAVPDTSVAAASPAPALSSSPEPTAAASDDATPVAPEAPAGADETTPAPAIALPATAAAPSSPAAETSDSAAPAPAAAPPVANEAATAAPSPATGEALAKVEPQAAPPPVAKLAPPPPVANLPPQVLPPPGPGNASAETTVMLQRANQLFASGDIVSARQFYERAAVGGSAAALCGVGKSFDPLVLRNIGVLGLVGDATTAMAWYRKAAEAGSEEAATRLKRLAASQRLDTQRR